MGIRHLKIFKTVCEEGSVTKAAQKLFMTQPAVSHAIKELETEKGFPLFDRISGRLYLTDVGAVLLQKAVAVLELFEEVEQMDAASPGAGTIRIGSCITVAGYWLPQIMKDFSALPNHHSIGMTVQVAAAEGVIEMLKANKIDIALLEGPYLLEHHAIIPFSSYRVIAVCSPIHPFAGGGSISIAELLAEPLLLREKGSAIRDPFDSWLLLQGKTVPPAVTSVNSQVLLQMAKENLGIAILADKVVQHEIEAGNLRRVNILEMNITNDISIAYHKNKYISDPLKGLIDFIQASEK